MKEILSSFPTANSNSNRKGRNKKSNHKTNSHQAQNHPLNSGMVEEAAETMSNNKPSIKILINKKIIKLLHKIFVKKMHIIYILIKNDDFKLTVVELENKIFNLVSKNTREGDEPEQSVLNQVLFHSSSQNDETETSRKIEKYHSLLNQLKLCLHLMILDDNEESNEKEGNLVIDLKDKEAQYSTELLKLILEKKSSVEIYNINPEFCDFDTSLILAIHGAIYNHVNVFNDAIINIVSNFSDKIGNRLDILMRIWGQNEEIENLPSFIDLKNLIEELRKLELEQAKKLARKNQDSGSSAENPNLQTSDLEDHGETEDPEMQAKLKKLKSQSSTTQKRKMNNTIIDLDDDDFLDLEDIEPEFFVSCKKIKENVDESYLIDQDLSYSEEINLNLPKKENTDNKTTAVTIENNSSRPKNWVPLNLNQTIDPLNDSILDAGQRIKISKNTGLNSYSSTDSISDSLKFLSRLNKILEKSDLEYPNKFSESECLEILNHIINVSNSLEKSQKEGIDLTDKTTCKSTETSDLKTEAKSHDSDLPDSVYKNNLVSPEDQKILEKLTFYVQLLNKAVDNRKEIIKSLNILFFQNIDIISNKLTACYYLVICHENEILGLNVEEIKEESFQRKLNQMKDSSSNGNAQDDKNLIFSDNDLEKLNFVINFKTNVISKSDKLLNDIILAYCNKKNWSSDWLSITNSNDLTTSLVLELELYRILLFSHLFELLIEHVF